MSERVWPVRLTVVPYVLLAFLTAVTVLIKRTESRSLLTDLALCAVTAVWMLGMFTVRPDRRERFGPMAVFIAGFVVLMAVLVIRDPWFGFLTPAGYFYAFILLPWPARLVGVGAVAVVAGTAQAYGVPKDDVFGWLAYAAVVAVNVLAMCLAAWLGWSRDVLSRQRQTAVDELTDTNRRLEASLAANAVLHDQLVTQAREAGIGEERQRMAREIHDTLAQGLTGIVTQLQAAEHAEDWRRHVTVAVDLARDSLTEARRSVDALRPQPLQFATLSEAIADVVRRWSALHGIDVQLNTTGTPRVMTPDSESTLLRATQEALANVAKYASADGVSVSVQRRNGRALVEVADNGVGGADPAQGSGLRGLADRVEALGGALALESPPGLGTVLRAEIPCES